MNRLKTLPILIVFLFCKIPLMSQASQSMPALIANHTTKKCATMFTGDECVSCSAPEGWEILGEAYSGKCPKEYTTIEKGISGKCKGRETCFCCTVMHSGSNGDCTNVVVNEKEKKCAFVDNLPKCKQLPQGWKKPKNQEFWGTVCPSLDYEWLNNHLECEKK